MNGNGKYSTHQQTTNVLAWAMGNCKDDAVSTTTAGGRTRLLLDVGSNSGFFGMFAMSRGCRSVLVEFEPELAKRLRRAAFLNGFSDGRASIVHAAISNKEGNVASVRRGSWGGLTYMKEIKGAGGGQDQDQDQDQDQEDSQDQIQTTTISAIMRRRAMYDDGMLAAIKIDVEGAELKALQGALPYLMKLREQDPHAILPDITCEIGKKC